jgi:hypothetical protein
LVFTAAQTDIFYHLKISNGPKCTAGTDRVDFERISGLPDVHLREAWPWPKLTTSSTAANILISNFCFMCSFLVRSLSAAGFYLSHGMPNDHLSSGVRQFVGISCVHF